ncbi:unnamed protein product [Macrosiphum euphorbiae]|uniref:ZAD domain-containing protein n=1 Tax=Macrosiphum euphorbiae TaxID=13131 RepID=A0AAV0WDR5_9HEMI|nr:unnamed protein product [Macrosiphum euphorbiae]
MSQAFLLIENFDVCRICLTERHTDGHEPFVHITTLFDGQESKEIIFDWLKINIKSDDGLPNMPNMICKCCSVTLDNFHALMNTANESYIVLDYIAKKRVSEICNIKFKIFYLKFINLTRSLRTNANWHHKYHSATRLTPFGV